MPCIFCGNERLTREHVYSRAWIERLAPHATSFTNTRASELRQEVPVNTWVSSGADVVVRCVCAECNNGWMNDLDQAAEKMVNAMCRGEVRVRVEGPALPLFAAWAMKMALVMECLLTPMVVPQEVRDRFYRERTPPPGVRVWVATMEAWDGETRTTPMTLVSAPEMGTVDQAYLVTFRVLHLVVQVLVPLAEGVQPEHDEWGQLHSELAWPRTEPLEFPLLPGERMLESDEDYFRLSESFRTETLRL